MKPIIMSAESVRAILDGRKTQTRRVIKPQPEPFLDTKTKMVWSYHHRAVYGTYAEMAEFMRLHSPYTVGQRLWVREKWRPVYMTPRPRTEELSVVQYADGSFNRDDWGGCKVGETWRSPIFMPRAFSRITLEVTGNRGERLWDITYDDILAEGWHCGLYDPIVARTVGANDARKWYATLWDRLNPQYPWDSNPWVWVVEFRRIQ